MLTPILAMAVAAATAMLILLRPRRLPEPLARHLKLPPLPYAYACALSANAASFVLPVSNPANILVLAGAPMTLAGFVGHLWLPSLASIVVTLAGLLALTWTTLDAGYQRPPARPVDRRAKLGLLGLAILAAGYLLSDRLAVPLGVVACLGALVLALQVAAGLDWIGTAAVALGTAALSNVINNLPMALVAAASLRHVGGDAAGRLAAGAIVGIDLGPNLTTVGSFATMPWLMLLRRRGLDLSAAAYARVGLLVTPPALLAAILALGLTR